MTDFFISFTRADLAWAEWVAWQLEDAGFSVTYQPWDFLAGRNFVSEMDKATKQSERTVAVLSQSYVRSGFGSAEWMAAFKEDPIGENSKLIPIRIEEFKPEGLLAEVIYIDLVGLDEVLAAQRLQAGVAQRRGKPAQRPRYPGHATAKPLYPGIQKSEKKGDAESGDVLAQLEDAYYRRAHLSEKKRGVKRVQREILQLRRRLREGGQLKVNDYLLDGRIRLLDRVGHGGFATVWKAYDSKHQGFVAVKILHGQYAHDKSRLERFFRGSRRMAELQHPGIVRVVDEQLEDSGFYFFTMQYLSGGDLRRAVLSGRISQAKALEVIIEVGSALQFAHERGLIHRDIKPANILIGGDGHSRLTDFDLVYAMDSTGGTRTGTLGTVVYAAPEIVERPHEATILADVYGLGMTAVFALSGADLSLNIFREAEVVIDSLDTTAAVKLAIKKSIAWRPAERFSSVQVLCEELQSAINAAQRKGPPSNFWISDASPETWASSRKLFQAAAELDTESRIELLNRIPGDAYRIRSYVERLLEGFDLDHQTETEFDVPETDFTENQEIGSMEGRRVGDYRLLRIIGRGGMAVVYLAERADELYRAQVAVKLMRTRNRRLDRQFYIERQILATLHHHHIASLLDGGMTEDHIPYIVMEFVEGISIDRFCEEPEATLEVRLKLFRQVCSAVQFAHQRLVIHGDLKPANILVDSRGQVKLLDFGIGKILETEFDRGKLTRPGLNAFTPAYASPEQILGMPLTTSTDVYILGVLLYELLTGKLPYAAEPDHVRHYELGRLVVEVTPPLPSTVVTDRSLRRQLAGDLDIIVAMALRKEPERRYSSVEQLAEDISRYLGGLPVAARRDTLGYRLRKFVGRHRISVLISLPSFLIILVLGVVIILQALARR